MNNIYCITLITALMILIIFLCFRTLVYWETIYIKINSFKLKGSIHKELRIHRFCLNFVYLIFYRFSKPIRLVWNIIKYIYIIDFKALPLGYKLFIYSLI